MRVWTVGIGKICPDLASLVCCHRVCMSDLTSSGGMVSFDPEGAPAAPEIADKGMMLSYAHIFAGLIPQPGDGGIVYVLGDADDAACLSQAWAPAAAAPLGSDRKRDGSADERRSHSAARSS